MIREAVVSFLAAWGLLAPGVAHADAKNDNIKIATLAPADSPWGQVYKVWQRALREKSKLPDGQKTSDGSDHTIDATMFWNAQQGDEVAMVSKMKSGQIDGAVLTATGMSQIYKNIAALQMPGLFRDWETLDRARDELKGVFEEGLHKGGFTLIGWGDVGLAHAMTKGVVINSPEDLKGVKGYVFREDPVAPVFFQVMGGVTPVPMSIPEILPSLNVGAINIVIAPALAAEQLQWASRLDHINTEVLGAAVGGFVVTNRRMDALTADQRAIIMDTSKIAQQAMQSRIRKEDSLSYVRLIHRMTPYAPPQDQFMKWTKIFREVNLRLSQGTFPKDLCERLATIAGLIKDGQFVENIPRKIRTE